MRLSLIAFAAPLALLACTGAEDGMDGGNGNAAVASSSSAERAAGRPFQVEVLGEFDEPWAMTFLPGTNQALITEKRGRLLLWDREGPASAVTAVAGVPPVEYGGQLGLGDVVAHPDFPRNRMIYLSWSEAGPSDTRGAAVGRARLVTGGGAPRLEGLQVIWRQDKVDGRFHHAHRIAFSPGGHLFITSGDRMKFEPAQDPASNIGKIVRLNADGSIPRDNPWASRGGTAAQLWTIGHRNPLGIAFDRDGRLWAHEMGPRTGDELNLIDRGANYGWPTVSNGDHYDGRAIPDHPTRPEFRPPVITWNGVSPAGLMVYSGRMFRDWRGSAFLGALSGQALIRVQINGTTAREADRWPMAARIREVEEGPDGAIYVLEDERNNSGGRLLRLTPAR